jgi:hypothetical protein
MRDVCRRDPTGGQEVTPAGRRRERTPCSRPVPGPRARSPTRPR